MKSKFKLAMVSLIKAIDTLNKFLGEKIAWLNLLTVVVFFAVTTLRYIFNYGSIAMQESAIYSHILVFVFASAWVLRQDQHVRVDVFYRKFSAKTKALLNALGALFFLMPVSIFIIWVSLDYVGLAWQIKEGSPDVGGLPYYYLLKLCVPTMFVLLFLQGFAEFLRNSIYFLTNKDYKEIV